MQNIIETLTKKKKKLDSLRPLSQEKVKNLRQWFDIEYTYTSNAIEGSTLTRSETALVVEKGLTVRGKPLKEHLEAVNHNKAIYFMRSLIDKGHQFITQQDIKNIHNVVLSSIDDQWAGKYRLDEIFITGATVEPPLPHHVPFKMKSLIEWLELEQGKHPAQIAADLHFKFVAIHPFIDGNGRTARLLMNLVLMQNGYPITIIKTEERAIYIDAINEATITGDLTDFYKIIFGAVERSLDAYIAAANSQSILPFFIDKHPEKKQFIKIGEFASLAGVTIPTIRHYIEQHLIKPVNKTSGGFMLFTPDMVKIIEEIKKLQKEKKLTIAEIRKELN